MSEKMIRNIMFMMIAIGLTMIAVGISIIVFSDTVTTKGTDGIFTIAGFIAGGLFISVPAKIYLTLQLMKYNDEKLQAENAEKVRLAAEAVETPLTENVSDSRIAEKNTHEDKI